jgi:hypothetical protein
MYYTFNLYDGNFKKIKELTRIMGSTQNGNIEVLVRKYQSLTQNDHCYIKGSSNDFAIEVYNGNGEREIVIENDCIRIPVNEDHKDDIYRMYKEHPLFGQYFESIKDRIKFPQYLPAIHNINIANNRLYALTYLAEGDNSIVYSMDLDGDNLRKLSIPLIWKGVSEVFPYTVTNNNFYQLVKNESGKWELMVISFQ